MIAPIDQGPSGIAKRCEWITPLPVIAPRQAGKCTPQNRIRLRKAALHPPPEHHREQGGGLLFREFLKARIDPSFDGSLAKQSCAERVNGANESKVKIGR
jgi:hypothetical protein